MVVGFSFLTFSDLLSNGKYNVMAGMRKIYIYIYIVMIFPQSISFIYVMIFPQSISFIYAIIYYCIFQKKIIIFIYYCIRESLLLHRREVEVSIKLHLKAFFKEK